MAHETIERLHPKEALPNTNCIAQQLRHVDDGRTPSSNASVKSCVGYFAFAPSNSLVLEHVTARPMDASRLIMVGADLERAFGGDGRIAKPQLRYAA